MVKLKNAVALFEIAGQVPKSIVLCPGYIDTTTVWFELPSIIPDTLLKWYYLQHTTNVYVHAMYFIRACVYNSELLSFPVMLGYIWGHTGQFEPNYCGMNIPWTKHY